MAEANPSKEEMNASDFHSYHWEEDEGWQVLLRNLEFPSAMDEHKKEKFLLKRKRKYFKQKINPDYVFTDESSDSFSQEKGKDKEKEYDSPSNPHTSSSKSKANNDPPTPPFSTSPTPPQSAPQSAPVNEDSQAQPQSQQQSQARNDNNNNRGRERRNAGSPPVSNKTGLARAKEIVMGLLNYYYLGSQLIVLSCSVLSLMQPSLYYRVLMIAVAMHIVALFQNNGRPRMSQHYAQRVFQDENLMIAFTVLLLMLGPPSLFLLSPVLLRSVFMTAYMMNGLIGQNIPSLHRLLFPYLNKVLMNQQFFNSNVALLEVFVGIYLIVAIFFMKNAIILSLLYWQVMGTKYQLNYNSRMAFAQVNSSIEAGLSKIPVTIFLTAYRKVVGMIYGMVDPQRMAQGGGRPKCVIM